MMLIAAGCRRFGTGLIIGHAVDNAGRTNAGFTVSADFVIARGAGTAFKINLVVFGAGVNTNLQRIVTSQVFAFNALTLGFAAFIVVLAVQRTGFALANLIGRTFAPAVRTLTAFIGVNFTLVILTGVDAYLEIALALLGVLPGTLAGFALVVFSAAAVRLGDTGRLGSAGTAVIIVNPVFRQFVLFAFAGLIFAVAGFANADISFSVANLIVVFGTFTVSKELQAGDAGGNGSVIVFRRNLLLAAAAV